jgi:hypothetical protein
MAAAVLMLGGLCQGQRQNLRITAFGEDYIEGRAARADDDVRIELADAPGFARRTRGQGKTVGLVLGLVVLGSAIIDGLEHLPPY